MTHSDEPEEDTDTPEEDIPTSRCGTVHEEPTTGNGNGQSPPAENID